MLRHFFIENNLLNTKDPTLLYSVPWVNTYSDKKQLDVDVIVFFFSRLCCDLASLLRFAALRFYLDVLLKFSLRLS
jgi:hypothetical protein